MPYTQEQRDYFTISMYEHLQTMVDHKLSQVESITVSSRGLGAVQQISKNGVQCLDLVDPVLFDKEEVIVYMDDEKKHELGKLWIILLSSNF